MAEEDGSETEEVEGQPATVKNESEDGGSGLVPILIIVALLASLLGRGNR